MDSTYRSVKATLPQLTTFELCDLLDEIHSLLTERDVEYTELNFSEQGAVDPALWDEYEGMAYDD